MPIYETEQLSLLSEVCAALTEDLNQDWRLAWRRAAKAGLFQFLMPDTFGGAAQSAEQFVGTMRRFGALCPDNGFTMGVNAHVWTVQHPLVQFGSEDQKAKYLPDLCTGQSIGAFALTEKSSGSDALALTTRADRQGTGYLLNGAKTYVGMAPVCDLAIVFASTAPEKKSWGVSAFIVEATDKGFERRGAQAKAGLKTLPMGQLAFQDCWIPEDRRIGPEGSGAQLFQAVLDWERAFILAPHVGAMSRQLSDCVSFARTRQSFGKPIIEHQSVANRIADMSVRLETSRLLLEQAARTYDNGGPLTALAAMCNLHISEAFLASSLDAVRTFGGAGYLSTSHSSIDVADALGGVIYSGTSDVQRQIIAKLAGRRGDAKG